MVRRHSLAATTDQPGRIVLYIRVSAVMGRGDEAFHSPDIQVDGVLTAAARLGLQEVLPSTGERVMDIDVSGRTFVRDGLDVILEMARNQQTDVVGVNDLSRLGRNLRESLNFIADLRELGVHVISAREHIDDTPQGRFILAQFLALAELYSDQVGMWWAATALRRAAAGYHSGVPPRGYMRAGTKVLDNGRVRATGPLVVDPTVGPYVTEVFERHAAGERLADIVAWWWEKTGQRVDLRAIKRLLRNRTYLGRVVLNGREWPGVQPGLTDEETFERCQRRLNRDRFVPPRTLGVVHALAGMIVCDRCSVAIIHRRLGKDVRDPGPFYFHKPFLMGGGSTQGGEPCRGGGTPRVTHVEEVVLDVVTARIARLAVDQAARAERARRVVARAGQLGQAERNLAAAGEALGRLTVQFARGILSEEAYKLAAAELEGERARLGQLVDQLRDGPPVPELSRDVVSLAGRLARLWPAMTPPERQQALRACEVVQVRVVPASYRREPLQGRVRVLFDGDEVPG